MQVKDHARIQQALCRLPYFALKEGIRQILDNVDNTQTKVRSNAELGHILQPASELRTRQ
jgi:hypothetical protein